MVRCDACGVDNADGTQFCVNCGAALAAAAAAPPPPVYDTPPTYQADANPPIGGPMQPAPAGLNPEPMHPGIAALLSFLLPGLGLVFFENKKQLGIYMLAGTVGGVIVLVVLYTIISFVTMGFGGILGCCFILLPLWNLFAALYTYDLTAKEIGGGKYKPLVFK